MYIYIIYIFYNVNLYAYLNMYAYLPIKGKLALTETYSQCLSIAVNKT